jgi:Zn-dependent protease
MVSHEAALPADQPAKMSLPVMFGLSVAAVGTFAWLWGLERALLMAVVIIVHEAGHALAMRMVGIRIEGITLVPFLGGVAIPAEPILHDGKHGFVALMGPVFSLATTLAFLLAGELMGEPRLVLAALVSATINLLNLVPVLPFDGGKVVSLSLAPFSRRLARLIAIGGAAALAVVGLRFAWMARDVMLALIATLGLLPVLIVDADESETEPMQRPAAVLLLAAYAATIVAYIVLILVILNGGFTEHKFAVDWHL